MKPEHIASLIVVAATIVASLVFVIVYSKLVKKNKEFSWARFAARVGIFGALSTILYIVKIFEIHLPFLPPFLALHFDEIPAFIAGFAYGPFAALLVILIKSVIKLPFSSTLLVGELADFIFSCAFVLPTVFIYKKIRSIKGALIGFGVGMVIQVIVAMALNVYAMLPFYMNLYHMNAEGMLAICQGANPAIKDIEWSYAFFAVLPLNLIKDTIVIIVTFLIYRNIRKVLHWEEKKQEPEVVETKAE